MKILSTILALRHLRASVRWESDRALWCMGIIKGQGITRIFAGPVVLTISRASTKDVGAAPDS